MKSYSQILDTVFSGYRGDIQYTIPDHWLSLSFVNLIKRLQHFQKEEILQSLPPFDYNDYCNLDVNHETMIRNYPHKKLEILTYRAKIEQLFYEKCKTEGSLPLIFEQDIEYYDQLMTEHKKRRGLKPAEPVQTSSGLTFTAGVSKKKSIYTMLEKHKNEWVDKKYIMKNVDVKYDDFRSIIAQLRDDIAKQGLLDSLRIDNDRKGGYKLTTLSENTTTNLS